MNHNIPCKQRAKCCHLLLRLTGAAVCAAAGCIRLGSAGGLGVAVSSSTGGLSVAASNLSVPLQIAILYSPGW